MRSKIKEYDMYKAGEYIYDYNDTKMRYWKKFDMIEDEELKLEILRINDKINKKGEIFYLFLLLCYLILGVFVGMVWSYLLFM
jgi:hypothetical protein